MELLRLELTGVFSDKIPLESMYWSVYVLHTTTYLENQLWQRNLSRKEKAKQTELLAGQVDS